MQVNLVKKKISYTAKDGSTKQGYNFYLVAPSGKFIAIRNSFSNDYAALGVIADMLEEKK